MFCLATERTQLCELNVVVRCGGKATLGCPVLEHNNVRLVFVTSITHILTPCKPAFGKNKTNRKHNIHFLTNMFKNSLDIARTINCSGEKLIECFCKTKAFLPEWVTWMKYCAYLTSQAKFFFYHCFSARICLLKMQNSGTNVMNVFYSWSPKHSLQGGDVLNNIWQRTKTNENITFLKFLASMFTIGMVLKNKGIPS